MLLLTLFPWQEWLLIHALELLPSGRFRFRTVLVLVARQNGKSTVSIVLALFFLFVLKVTTVLGTAQDLDTAEEVWEQAVSFVEEMDDDTELPVRPDLKAEHHHTSRTNGKMALVLTRANRHQRRYKVKAANRRAGRGYSGDLVMLDELREHQTWDAWSAITKDLANSTPMLMADGTWSTIGEVQVGDFVFAPSGKPVEVTQVHPIARLRPMYRVTTTDGRSVLASESHLWTVRRYNNKTWRTMTTAEILDSGITRPCGAPAYRLPSQDALRDLPEADLPLDPYILGAWLGDGTSVDGTLTVGAADLEETCRILESRGATVTARAETRPGTWLVRLHVEGPLRTRLRVMGLLSNKHVPAAYETASRSQRLDLLRGLLDTDGCVTTKGCVHFTATRETLADSVLFLARSLGWVAYKSQIQPMCGDIRGSAAWMVTFSVRTDDDVPFLMERKARRCLESPVSRPKMLTSIRSIEPVESEPSTCIGVRSADHLFLAGRDLVPTHNTMMGRPNGQTWAMSNAGDITSAVLRFLRKKAHERLGDPDGICARDPASNEMPSREDFARIVAELELEDFEAWGDELKELEDSADDLGIFEWSAAPECEVVDPRAWGQANPSMGYMISPQSILSAALNDPEWEFRTEVLCQWADDALTGPFPVNAFGKCAATRDVRGVLLPSEILSPTRRTTACLTVSEDRAWSYVTVCGTRVDGLPQVEVSATLEGTAGVVKWFTNPSKPHRKRWQVAVQVGEKAPEASLIPALKRAGIRVVPWKPADVATSWGLFYDAVKDCRIRQSSQKQLTDPASKSKLKPTESGAKVLDRRRARGTDPVPLVGAQGAYWLWQMHTRSTASAAPPVLAASTDSVNELERVEF